MEPIQNSVYKESLRQANENEAKMKEASINRQLYEDIGKLKPKPVPSATGSVVAGIGVLIVLAVMGNGFWIPVIGGIIASMITAMVTDASVKSFNDGQEKQKEQLKSKAAQDVRKVYEEADRKTQREMEQYDSEVKTHCQKILKNAANFTDMVRHQTDMFSRMISHANSGSNMRFVEADLIYTVNTYGISYSYNSSYSNCRDDYNFSVQRYRDLKSVAECEGLAQALARMTIARMKKIYPANSMNITVSHMDAQVTLHYKGANKNFVPARNIL